MDIRFNYTRKLYVACGSDYFGVSLEDPRETHRLSKSVKISIYKLDDKIIEESINCIMNGKSVDAAIHISPPHERGMCSALHHITLTVKSDGNSILSAPFANNCMARGITFFAFQNSYYKGVQVCGFGKEHSPISNVAGKTYGCTEYPYENILKSKTELRY